MKYLAIYYGIGVLHLFGTMATDLEEYRAIVGYIREKADTVESYLILFIAVIVMPIIWPQILFYQIFDKEVK